MYGLGQGFRDIIQSAHYIFTVVSVLIWIGNLQQFCARLGKVVKYKITLLFTLLFCDINYYLRKGLLPRLACRQPTYRPSTMNAIILVSVLFVGNLSVFGSSRMLAALADQARPVSVLRS